MPPWDSPAAELTDFLGEDDDPRVENTTAVIHPATMSPLLVWALRTVTDFAPDILATLHERRRLLQRIPATGNGRVDGPAARQRIRDYFLDLRTTGGPIPTYAGHLAPRLSPTGTRPGDRRPALATTFLAGTLAVDPAG
jgi:hypothetical protein